MWFPLMTSRIHCGKRCPTGISGICAQRSHIFVVEFWNVPIYKLLGSTLELQNCRFDKFSFIRETARLGQAIPRGPRTSSDYAPFTAAQRSKVNKVRSSINTTYSALIAQCTVGLSPMRHETHENGCVERHPITLTRRPDGDSPDWHRHKTSSWSRAQKPYTSWITARVSPGLHVNYTCHKSKKLSCEVANDHSWLAHISHKSL